MGSCRDRVATMAVNGTGLTANQPRTPINKGDVRMFRRRSHYRSPYAPLRRPARPRQFGSARSGYPRPAGRRRPRWRPAGWTTLVLVLLAVAYVVTQLVRPAPRPDALLRLPASVTAPGGGALPWPATGEAAVALPGLNAVRSSGSHRQAIASLAKMMTAYIVLRNHPLRGGAAGPTIRLTAADAATYRREAAAKDSVAAVRAGELLSERQALEALLVPSADNIALVLARWDAGSQRAFVARMNAEAARLGMSETHYADASGLSPRTVSTPSDQLRIAEAAMRLPVFSGIVALPAVTLPVAGRVQNYDFEVGHDGFIGIKTGSDNAAGGCWAFAARRPVAGRVRTVYGVVMGARSPVGYLQPALAAGRLLADALPGTVHLATVLPAGSVVGYLTSPWSSHRVAIVTRQAIRGLVASGAAVRFGAVLGHRLSGAVAGGQVLGRLTAAGVTGTSRTALLAARALPGPSLSWRLTRLP
jgi:D-alanyl-D-alanine carboxypeptidase (penicillin-binding protein 5/6)